MDAFFEKYNDPRWQEKRLRVMDRAGFQCERCGDKTTTLQVHHTHYVKAANPWDYEDRDLQCLCEPCHKRVGELITSLRRYFGRIGRNDQENVVQHVYELSLKANKPPVLSVVNDGPDPHADMTTQGLAAMLQRKRQAMGIEEDD